MNPHVFLPALVLTLLCAGSTNVRAATISVTNAADSGAGSLRAALASATNGDTIDATGVFGAIILTSGELLITNNLNINGSGPANLAVNGNFPNTTNRVFNINNSTVSISGLTITNGHSGDNSGGGGIIIVASTMTVSNCAVSGNSGGGASSCKLANCIAYFNARANYDPSCTLDHCCTTPLPTNGVGNISSDPQLASASHLSALSPCIGKGSYASVSGNDIDGEPWANPPSIGCDEYHPGAVTGPLTVSLTATYTTVLTGFTVQLTALIKGRTTASVWDFGDGIRATNQPYTPHAWAALGDYAVVLRAYNESQPGGISATATVHVIARPVHYVAAASATPGLRADWPLR